MSATKSVNVPPPGPAWRQFTFFDVVSIKDKHDLASAPEVFKRPAEISCTSSSSIGLLAADVHGNVQVLGSDFEPTSAWVAHQSGRVTHLTERDGVLVTLGEEDSVRFPILKIWDLRSMDKKTGEPRLLRSVKVQHGGKPHPVSTVALSATVSFLAIGLGDGTVLLYRHVDTALANAPTALTTFPKPKTLHESPTEPITGLGFREPYVGDTGTQTPLCLFVVTTNRVLCYPTSGRGSSGEVVDEVGAALGCAVMDRRAREVIVAREEAIYLIGGDGRGACYAYEGTKVFVHGHQNYLVIITPPVAAVPSATSATVRRFAMRAPEPVGEVTKVTVFDLENKFVAYSGAFTDGVRSVMSAFGNIYILSNGGQLSCLAEKPMDAKLEVLYRQQLYLLALGMAKTQQLDAERVADIHKQYGDHLYSKGEYDNSMAQFTKTIGYLQPSYVVRKFLDAQRIHNLVAYLQEIHARGLANADHTTLLLNAYTKLKDVTSLDSFIKTESRRTSSTDDRFGAQDDDLPFDLETAIRVCRQAGYFEHASYLAHKYHRHEDYLRIQIDDAGHFAEALSYIRDLGIDSAVHTLIRYGRALLNNLPNETTALLIDVCTRTGPLRQDEQGIPAASKQSTATSSYLSFMAVGRNTATVDATVVPGSPQTVATGTTARPEPRRQGSIATAQAASVDEASASSGTSTPNQNGTTKIISARPQTKRLPSPRPFFAHFVDHLDRFVTFLETIARKRWGQSVDGNESNIVQPLASEYIGDEEEKQDQIAVWNTLLELYLTLPLSGDEAQTTSFRAKALRLLRATDIPHDSIHALILCATRNFTPGLVLLWERQGMHEDVLRFWMDRHSDGSEADASKQVVGYLELYGPQRPELYPLVLRFLTSSNELLGKHTADITRVLEHIENEKIMSPVAVVQLLGRNGVASVGLVKQWLMTRIKSAREEIRTDERLIQSYRAETAAKLKQVQELEDVDHPRVFHNTRCATCGNTLDLPAVHFMCGHSYHQHECLKEHQTECPQCAHEHGVIREIRMNNERLADQHELFVAEVKDRGFEAVASAFGRGVMSVFRVDDVVA